MTSGVPHLVLIGGDGGLSGVPRHIEQICRVMTADDSQAFRITVLSEPDKGGYKFTQDLAIRHIAVTGLASSANPARIWRGMRALQTVLRDDPPDIIWAHARLSVLLTRLLIRQPGRSIITFHGSPFLGRSSVVAWGMRALEGLVMRQAAPHQVVFLSQRDRDSFNGLPLHRHRVRIIPNVAPEQTLPPLNPPLNPTLVMTTRDSPQKNLEAAVRIFAHLPDTTRLVLLGTGTDKAALQHRLATHVPANVIARITFHGPTDNVAQYLRSAHGYLLTSRYEGMSLGALEAFAAGLPVFMPDVGGRDEMKKAHPMCAEIIPDDPAQSATAIKALIDAFAEDPKGHADRITAAYEAAFASNVWSKQIQTLLVDTLAGQTS